MAALLEPIVAFERVRLQSKQTTPTVSDESGELVFNHPAHLPLLLVLTLCAALNRLSWSYAGNTWS